MIEAAIFDWDGTLADTRSVIVLSFETALKEVNLIVPPASIERRIGIGAAETFREILRTADRRVDEQVIKQLVKRKIQVQIQLSEKVALFGGARELLAELQGRLKLGLASMNNRSVVMHMLRLNKLVDCFTVVLMAEDVSNSKPNPEIFAKTAKQLQIKPENCVVFEDSIFGVKASKSAGMHCVAVTTGVYKASELNSEQPDLVVESLADPKITDFLLVT
jgi:beta-phosphoglucomutase